MFVANYYQSNVPYDVILILKKALAILYALVGLTKIMELLNLVNVKPELKRGKALFTCEACDNKHPATSFSLNCKEDMCKDAARFHTRNKASRDHQLIWLESAAATESFSKHKEPFRFFDKACGHVVCRGCIKLDHKGHKCSSFKVQSGDAGTCL